jgi:hypothetical protein
LIARAIGIIAAPTRARALGGKTPNSVFTNHTFGTSLTACTTLRHASANCLITNQPVRVAGGEALAAVLCPFGPAKVTNAGKAVLTIAVALTAVGRVVDAAQKFRVADHAVFTIFVTVTFAWLGIGVGVAANTPVFNALCVVTAVAVVTTAAVNFLAHAFETAFVVGAITIAGTVFGLRTSFLFTSVGLGIAWVVLGTDTVGPASDSTVVHRQADLRVALNALTFGTLGAIAVIFAADRTESAFGRLHTGLAIRTGITTITALAEADAFETDASFGTVAIRSAADKRQLTYPVDTSLIVGTVAILNAGLRT